MKFILAMALIGPILVGAAVPSHADDRFVVLGDSTVEAMTPADMAAVVGGFLIARVSCLTCGTQTGGTTTLQLVGFDNGAVGPCDFGLTQPHPKFPGTTNPAGKFQGWAASSP